MRRSPCRDYGRDVGIDGVESTPRTPTWGEWLTSTYNRREDDYGGSLTNRLRIVLEIVEAVRAAVGRDSSSARASTAHGYRMYSRSTKASRSLNGCTPQRLAFSRERCADDRRHRYSIRSIIPWAAAIKRALPSTVVMGAGVSCHGKCRSHHASGDVDMVAMTRASIADPELPEKARSALADVRLCIGAGQGCHHAQP